MVSSGGPSWRAWVAASVLWFGLGRPPVAHAFSEPLTYFDDPSNGGGGGRWFTGSPAEGYGCSVCHTGLPTQRAYPFYVEGLPTAGYVAGAVYNVRLSWPEFAVQAQVLRAAGGSPSMSVVAEFLAENGTSSGTLDIDPKHATPGEICAVPVDHPLPGMNLYSVHPVPTGTAVADGTNEVTHCDANRLGARCLLAVRACGAQEVLARWTAPAQWQGPIWFAAGFVATDLLSSTPEGDSVSEVARPLLPATSGSERYESLLHSNCSVGPSGSTASPSWPGAMAFGGICLLARSRLRRRRARPGRAHAARVEETRS